MMPYIHSTDSVRRDTSHSDSMMNSISEDFSGVFGTAACVTILATLVIFSVRIILLLLEYRRLVLKRIILETVVDKVQYTGPAKCDELEEAFDELVEQYERGRDYCQFKIKALFDRVHCLQVDLSRREKVSETNHEQLHQLNERILDLMTRAFKNLKAQTEMVGEPQEELITTMYNNVVTRRETVAILDLHQERAKRFRAMLQKYQERQEVREIEDTATIDTSTQSREETPTTLPKTSTSSSSFKIRPLRKGQLARGNRKTGTPKVAKTPRKRNSKELSEDK